MPVGMCVLSYFYGMIEYGLIKKKIFEQKSEESTQGRKDIRYKNTIMGACWTCSSISKVTGWLGGDCVRERLAGNNAKEVRQPESTVPSKPF